MKKKYIYFSLIIVTLIISVISFGLWKSYKDNKSLVLNSIKPLKNEYNIGDNIELSAIITSPLHNFPSEALFANSSSIMKLTNTKLNISDVGFSYLKWKVSIIIKPFRLGNLKTGVFHIRFNKKGNVEEFLKVDIPDLNIISEDIKSEKLILAEEIHLSYYEKCIEFVKKHKYWIIALGVLILILIVFITFMIIKWIRKKNLPPIIPAWQIALDAICSLRKKIDTKVLSNEIAFSQLTDLVKVYLEKRFALNAPTQTANEFLQKLKKKNSPLNENHRIFLKDFISSAEFIKFANTTANKNILDDSLKKAERLINETKETEGI